MDRLVLARQLVSFAKELMAADAEGEYKKKWKDIYGYDDEIYERVAIECGGAFKLLKKNSSVHTKGVCMVFSLIARDFQLAKKKIEAVLAEVNKSEWLAFNEACTIHDDFTVEMWIGGNEAFYKKACEEYESLAEGQSGVEETKARMKAEEDAIAFLKDKVAELQRKINEIKE